MAVRYYILDGQTPVPEPDVLRWADWFETADRGVQRDGPDGWTISTVFLGLDHGFGEGDPILFETHVYRSGHPGDVIYERRCSTWDEALAMHQRALEWFKENRPPF